MSLKRKLLTSVLALSLTAVLSAQTTFAYSNVTLKNGMRSDDVYTLQEDLNKLGLMSVKPTGYYGSITKAAVLEMQKKYGLLTDGIAGKQTLGKLDSLMGRNAAETKASAVSEGSAASENSAVSDNSAVLETSVTSDISEASEASTASGTSAASEVSEAGDANTVAAVAAEDNGAAKTAAESIKNSRGEQRLAENIIEYAKRFKGVKYVWGGTTTKGFDCSGFTKYVFGHFDVTIDRNSTAQAKNGSYIKKADLMPGDLVFFDTNGGNNRINHVGIYIGNGNMIHSSSSHKGVVISTISSGFYAKSYMTARRVL